MKECDPGLTLMATLTYRGVPLIACENLTAGLNGSISFAVDGGTPSPLFPLTLHKRSYSNQPTHTDDTYLNFSKHEVLNASSDIMGNLLLGIHGFPARAEEPTLSEVLIAMPPLRHLGSWGGNGARVWTASRGSGVDCVFDENGANHLSGTHVWQTRPSV